MGGIGAVCAKIFDERVDAFLTRPIEGGWPCLWINAPCLTLRQGGRIVSAAVTIAGGVNTDARRSVTGTASGASEAKLFWTQFVRASFAGVFSA